jgi:hypothetical protein
MKFAQWAKMYVALLGLLASAALGVTGIPLSWKLPLALVVAAAGAFATWKVENAPEDPPAPRWRSAGPAWEPADGTYADYPEFEDEPYEDDYML